MQINSISQKVSPKQFGPRVTTHVQTAPNSPAQAHNMDNQQSLQINNVSGSTQKQSRIDRFYTPIIKGKKQHKVSFRDKVEKQNGLEDVQLFQKQPKKIMRQSSSCCQIY